VRESPFGHSTFYVRRTRGTASRGKQWTFSFHHSNGEVFLEARFPEIPQEVIIYLPGHPESPLVRLQAWRWFWWNGRYDVVDCVTGSVLGTLRRTGGIEGPDGRVIGRVKNAMPVRKSLLHLFTISLLESLLSGGSDASSLPVDEFKIEANGINVGSLRRVTLPFLQAADPAQPAAASTCGGWLNRIRSRLRKHSRPSGWLLDYSASDPGTIDPRVRLTAALFCIQIEERYQ
jgi:hypothetical protein